MSVETRKRSVELLLVAALALLSLALPLKAWSETPTERIARCLQESWNANYECQTDDSRWNDLLCAVKFEADVILCTFPSIPQ